MCDIIIPIWNQLADTKDCINSIERNTAYPYRLILVDNASDPETKAYLDDLNEKNKENIILIRNARNEGFIKAVNKGIDSSSSEYVCMLNNDTVVTPKWLGELIAILEKNPGVGIVNPSSNSLGQKLREGVAPDDFARDSKGESGRFVETGNAFAFCMVVRSKLFDEIGLFDEGYGMGYFEDTDFSLRAKRRGYKTVRALASYVYHKEQKSFEKLADFKKDFRKNKVMFEAKWGKDRRIIVVFKELNHFSLSCLENILKSYAREKHWVYVISPPLDTKEFFKRYSNLAFYNVRSAFYLQALTKILFKKKKPDVVYSDNDMFSNVLKAFKPFKHFEIKALGEN